MSGNEVRVSFVFTSRRSSGTLRRLNEVASLPRGLLFALEDGLGVAPIDGLSGAPPLAAAGSTVLSRGARFRAGAVTVVETFRLALESLRAHKLRSFLTLLGVILAVTTLVTVMSVVSG